MVNTARVSNDGNQIVNKDNANRYTLYYHFLVDVFQTTTDDSAKINMTIIYRNAFRKILGKGKTNRINNLANNGRNTRII